MIKQHRPFQHRMTICKGYPTTCPHAWCTNKFGVKCIMCDEYRINITGKRSYRGAHRQDGYRLTVDDLKVDEIVGNTSYFMTILEDDDPTPSFAHLSEVSPGRYLLNLGLHRRPEMS